MKQAQRLSKVMARCGVASRRACEALVLAGRVRVNGVVAREVGYHVDPTNDRILLDREPISTPTLVYYALNKPRGYICSDVGSRTARSLLDAVPDRLFSVGRLDVDTAGLLLLTNDGDFAHRVLHPSHGVVREYVLKTRAECTDRQLATLRDGVQLDGEWIVPLRVQKVRRGTLKIAVGEGKNREVRRLASACELFISELTRIRIGNLTLGNLPAGGWRPLTPGEREAALAPHSALLAKTRSRQLRS